MNKHTQLKEYLLNNGEKNILIEKLYLLKFGCSQISESLLSDISSRFPITDYEIKKEKLKDSEINNAEKLFEYVVNGLKKCPNIFDLEISSTLFTSKYSMSWLSKSSNILLDKLITFKIHLPNRLQSYIDEISKNELPIEDFNIITTGSLFVAFSEIEHYPTKSYMGHEFRMLFKKQIESETVLKVPPLGPTPIHPNFYLVINNSVKKSKNWNVRIYSKKEDVIIVADRTFEPSDKLVEQLFKTTLHPLLEYYVNQIKHSRLHEYHIEIENVFDDLTMFIKKIHTTPYWRIIKRNRVANSARLLINILHSRIVEYETEIFQYENKAKYFNELIEEHRIFAMCKKYFEDQMELNIKLPSTLLQAISHYESEIQTFGNIQSVVISSLLGAIIGAVVTTLLAQ